MLVPFDMADPSLFKYYDDYYRKQHGNGGYAVHRGRTQRGNGLGGMLKSGLSAILPMLKSGAKSIGKSLLNTGIGIAQDALEGKDVGASSTKRFKRSASSLLRDLSSTLGDKRNTGGGVIRTVKKTKKTRKKKAKLSKGRDIFDETLM